MDRRETINNYVSGWLKNDKEGILNLLTDNCKIIESHGSKYNNKQEINNWINEWIDNKNTVDRWDIISYYETEEASFFEWNFECAVSNEKHKIEGISIVKFSDGRISYIREYKTKK